MKMKFTTATVIALCNGDICATPEENPDYQLCEGIVTNAYQGEIQTTIVQQKINFKIV